MPTARPAPEDAGMRSHYVSMTVMAVHFAG